jgi:hypothetical protein
LIIIVTKLNEKGKQMTFAELTYTMDGEPPFVVVHYMTKEDITWAGTYSVFDGTLLAYNCSTDSFDEIVFDEGPDSGIEILQVIKN